MVTVPIRPGPDVLIRLGNQGERNIRSIKFYVSEWVKDFDTGGNFVLNVRRYEEDTSYLVEAAYDGKFVTWNIGETDTEIAGFGECKLSYYVNDALAKTQTWQTFVEADPLQGTGEASDTAQTIYDTVGAIAAEAMTARDEAKQYAEQAAAVEAQSFENLPDEAIQPLVDRVLEHLPVYDGAFEATPLAELPVTLETSGKYLDRDITVKQVPVQSTGNAGGGYTAIIGG